MHTLKIIYKQLPLNKRIHQNRNLFSVQKIPISTLNELWKLNQSTQDSNLIEKLQTSKSGSEIYLLIVRAIKQNLFHDEHKKKIMLEKIQGNIDNMEYSRHMISLLLPINYQFQQLNMLYIRLAIKFLEGRQNPTFEDMFYILCNLQRTVFDSFIEWADEHWLVRDYTKQRELCEIMLIHIINKKKILQRHFILRFTKLCSVLNIYHPEYSEMLLQNLTSPECRLKLKEILEALCYLSEAKSFPNQYFYPRKRQWINIIETYPRFSTKKSFETLKFLQILIKENPHQSERIFQKIIVLLEENTLSLDNQEIARQWYLICKAKFLFPTGLIKKMLFKIGQAIPTMQIRQLCLLVRGFSRFDGSDYTSDGYSEILNKILITLPQNRKYEQQIIKCILDNQKQLQI